MRSKVFLDNIDASITQTSEELNLDKRTEWKVFIESTGLDGTPQLFIEEATTGSKCIVPTAGWTVYQYKCNTTGEFNIDSTLVTIEKKDFKSNWFRVRFEPNGNTTGNTTVRISYKTFP